MTVAVIHGDVLSGLAGLPADWFHCCVTSPPFWRLRSYPGVSPTQWADGQLVCLGAEADPDSFVRHLIEVFAGVWRVLRSDGILFVNIGETYASGKETCNNPGGGESSIGKEKKAAGVHPLDRLNKSDVEAFGLQPGDRCGIPQRFALAMQEAGWVWRDEVVWLKKSPMPMSRSGWRWSKCRVKVEAGKFPKYAPDCAIETEVPATFKDTSRLAKWLDCPGCPKCESNNGYVLRKGRFATTAAHEPIFMFVKGREYFCDSEAVKQPQMESSIKRFGNNPQRNDWNGKAAMLEPSEGMANADYKSRMPSGIVEGGALPRSYLLLSHEPTGAYEIDHWDRVEAGVLSDGMIGKASPDCPHHASWDRSRPSSAYGECTTSEASTSPRTSCSDSCLASGQSGDSDTIEPNRDAGTLPGSTGLQSPEDSQTASDHSNGSRKTDPAPLTSPPCKPSAQMSSCTPGTRAAREFFENCPGISDRKTSEHADPCDSQSSRSRESIAGTSGGSDSSEPSVELLRKNGCTCEFYHKITKEASHFASYPTKIPRFAIEMATSQAGCCPTCGMCHAPVVETVRTPTRPGEATKVNGDSAVEGNRDPERHVASTKVLGYRQCCECEPLPPVPCRVLDCFAGTGTSLQVANHLGRDSVGIEASAQYVEICKRKMVTPLRTKGEKKPEPVLPQQRRLVFNDGGTISDQGGEP